MKLFSSGAGVARRTGHGRGLSMLGAMSLCAATLGCGLAASPQPPSLHLPTPVHDLTAVRTGKHVTLHWETPKETTDRLRIHTPVRLRICRAVIGGSCESVATLSAAPGKPTDYEDTLPAALTRGRLRAMSYEIFGLNQHGRSAGPSNAAATLAGEAPPPVEDFSAAVVERGVILHWKPLPALMQNTSIHLQRKLLSTPEAGRNSRAAGELPPISEPVEQALRVPPRAVRAGAGMALDTSAEFNRKYEYVAIRICRAKIGTQWIRVAGRPSTPVVIFTRDTFPPAAPTGLAAVPVPASLNHGMPEVDLSWSANTEPDLAQYFVYRRDVSLQMTAARIAPKSASAPVVAPAFRDTAVQPGHTYAYSVVAVDNAGNRSPHSAEAVVTVPGS